MWVNKDVYIFNKVCLSLCHCPGLCPNDNAKLRHAAPALHVVAMCARNCGSLSPCGFLSQLHSPVSCFMLSFSTFQLLPHIMPIGLAATFRRSTYFFCAAPPTPSIAAYGLFLWRQFAAQHIVTVYRTAIIVYRFTLRLWQLVLQSEGHPKPDAGGFARSPGQSERNERHPGLAPPCHPRAVSAKALKGGCVPSGR